MIVRSMRWGDDFEVSTNPIEANILVEICVTDEEGHNYFIADTMACEDENIFVSPYPLYDLLMHMFVPGVDFDTEYKKCESIAIEAYEFETTDEDPQEIAKSRFADAIRLTRLAVQAYSSKGDEWTHLRKAKEYIAPYLNQELEEMELPEYKMKSFRVLFPEQPTE